MKKNDTLIKGYLYRNQDGDVILANEPNLRSCCVGKEGSSYLILKGDFPEDLPRQMATIGGSLQYPYLYEATLISTSSSNYGTWIMLAFFFLSLFFISRKILQSQITIGQ